MKKRSIILVITIFLILINNIYPQSSTFSDYVPTIPSDRRVDWHNAGDKQIPSSYNKIFNVLN